MNHYLKKELYQLIKEDESIFDFVQERAFDGLWYWDLESPEDEWLNARFWTSLGYNPNEMPHKSSAWKSIINPDDLKVALDNFYKYIANPEKYYEQEVRYTHKNGSTIWARCRGMLIRDENGKPIRMLGTQQNITAFKLKEQELTKAREKAEQSTRQLKKTVDELQAQNEKIKQLEKSLRSALAASKESEEKYRFLAENTSDVLSSLNPLGEYTYLSPNIEELTGYTISEYQKIGAFNNILPADQNILKEGFEKFKQGADQQTVEYRIYNKSGEIIWVQNRLKATRNENGELVSVLSSSNNITQHKNAENELKKQRDLFEVVINAAPARIFWKDLNSVYMGANVHFLKVSGFEKAEDLVGRSDDTMAWEKYAEKYRADDQEVIQSGKPKLNYGEEFIGADGKKEFWRTNKMPLKDANNNILGVVVTAENITQEKKVADKLKISNERFNLAMEATSDGLFDWNLIANETYLSPRWKSILGYRDNELTDEFSTWEKLMNPEDLINTREVINQCIHKERDKFSIEFKMRHKKGHWVDILARANVYFNDEGKAHRIIGTHSNITKRKSAEAELAKVYQELKTIFDNDPTYIWIKDTKNNILKVSNSVLATTGLKKEQIEGKHAAVLGAMVADKYYAADLEVINSGKPKLNFLSSLPLPNGDTRWTMTSKFPIRENGKDVSGILVFSSDVTELKNNEERLRLSIDGANLGLWEWNLKTGGFYVGDKWYKIIGHKKEETEVNEEWYLQLVHPEDKPNVSQIFRNHLKGKTELFKAEYRVKTKSGKWIWIQDFGKVIERDSDNSPIRIVGINIDITERKQYELKIIEHNHQKELLNNELIRANNELLSEKEKVEEARIRYESMFKNNSSVMLLIEPASQQIIDANQAACDYYQYSYAELTALKISQINLLSEEKMKEEMQLALQQKRNHFFFKHQLADGTIKDVEVYSGTVSFSGQNFLYSIIHDISARKEAQRKLLQAKREAEESEQKFAAFMGSLPGSAFIKDHELNYLFVNRFMEKNLDAAKWIGKNTQDLVRSEILPQVIEDDKKTFKQGRHKFEESIVVKGRGIRDFLTYKFTIDSQEGKPLLGGISIDITERKSLETRNNMLSTAIEASPVSVIITNKNGSIEYVNQFFTEMTGYSAEEVLGKNPNILKSENQSPEFYKSLWNTILAGKNWQGEILNKKKNGELFWENAAISPVINKKGEIIHFIAVKEDVTKLKNTLNDLQQTKEKAEESDKLKTAFLANMSHEIRTPMNGIMGFTDLLKDPEISGEEQQEFIQIIQESSKRMMSTISDIINISKIESGLEEIKQSEIELVSFMVDLYQFFKPEADKKNLELVFANSKDSSSIRLYSDSEKLHSILSNLIKNAIKFTPEGKIVFGYTLKNEHIEFFIRDTGIGVPKHRQQAIFERFVQADIADSRVFEGSGLGLAISKSYTEMLGGTISLESQEHEGSTFFISLPINETQDHTVQIMEEQEQQTKPTNDLLKILIAEDDLVSVQLLSLFIKKVASEILIAQDGKQAIEMAKLHPDIDLILMDVKMPNIDGFEATEEIRKFNSNVKIIAQTAFAQESDCLKAFEVGCDDYLTKPINKKLLNQSIQTLFFE